MAREASNQDPIQLPDAAQVLGLLCSPALVARRAVVGRVGWRLCLCTIVAALFVRSCTRGARGGAALTSRSFGCCFRIRSALLLARHWRGGVGRTRRRGGYTRPCVPSSWHDRRVDHVAVYVISELVVLDRKSTRLNSSH